MKYKNIELTSSPEKSKYKVYCYLSGLGSDKSVDLEKRKAAEMKMFGKLTRQTVEWIPARILCVRYKILLKWNLDDLISSYSLLQSCNLYIQFIMPFKLYLSRNEEDIVYFILTISCDVSTS